MRTSYAASTGCINDDERRILKQREWNMTRKLSYSRDILAMGDKELEVFVHRWVAQQTKDYVDHEEFGNANDLGRDVVGFVTVNRHEGAWDNYQCKMLGKTLDDGSMYQEIGKILYFASEGNFTPPRKYIFVAPKGFNRKAEYLLNNPNKFRELILSDWDKRCAKKITSKQSIPLTAELKKIIEEFDFTNITGIDVAKMLTLNGIDFVLADTFGDDPGESPEGDVPENVSAEESEYIRQLLAVYSDHESKIFLNISEILNHPIHKLGFNLHRRRYYDADAFRRHFRDNLKPEHLNKFNDEILAGVYDVYCSTDGMQRIANVMTQASVIDITGIFGRHKRASIQVRQGTCHHFANEGTLPWKI